MNDEQQVERWEQQVREQAAAFDYPPTPDIVAAVRDRLRRERAAVRPRYLPRPRPAMLALAALALALLLVPPVRAGLRLLFEIGAVRIFGEAVVVTPSPAFPPPTALPPSTQQAATAEPQAVLPPTASIATPALPKTPIPMSQPLLMPTDLVGETTLEDARALVPFRLPSYPPDVGEPDRVFVQHFGSSVAILVWLKPGSDQEVRWSLHALSDNAIAQKLASANTVIEETTVHDGRAIWVRGPHFLRFMYDRRGDSEYRPVPGNVLIWTEDDLTYRLEVPDDLPLEEARKIAESLR